jgi:hypothetical protein
MTDITLVKLAQRLVVAASLLGLAGCATPARVDSMRVSGTPSQRIAPSPFRGNLAIGDVIGGKETNPLWTSQVGSVEFERALEASLGDLGLLAPRQGGRFVLNSALEKTEQPLFGVSFTVTSTVHYAITERATGKLLLDKSLTTPYTAEFSDALLGVERLRLANEGSIRENISRFIKELDGLNPAPAN